MKARTALFRVTGGIGAFFGYGCLIAFLALVGTQVYRWFREGEWPHIGMGGGIHSGLTRCCVKEMDTGRLVALVHWLESPVDWLGLHRIFDIVPASMALFILSIAGNCLFIYSRDRLHQEAG